MIRDFELLRRKRLVRYEDLIEHPRPQIARLFDFIEVPVPVRSVDAIQARRTSARHFPEIAADIRALCEALQGRLLARYRGERAAVQA